MTWRPASRRSATKGVVFQMSTMQTVASAVLDCEIHATGWSTRCRRIAASFTTPKTSSSIHFHIWAATTVGIAHGMSIIARIAPRPRKPEFTARAMIIPSTSSIETVIAVNFTVVTMESRKIVSSTRSR